MIQPDPKPPACDSICAPMSIFRLLVAWLVLAALPLQGVAAASMLFCGQAATAGAAVDEAHAGHDHGHHAAAAAHDGHAADAVDHGSVDHGAADHGDPDHKCPVCGGLCHAVAIPETAPVLPWADAPSADLPQPGVPALTRAPPRPHKPPRA